MKFKTTKKAICDGAFCIVSFSYCSIQTIEQYLSPIAYTKGIYGWNCDIYEPTAYNIQLTTGYRPFEYYLDSKAKKLGALIKEEILLLEESLKSSNINEFDYIKAQEIVKNKISNIIHDCYKEIEIWK